jgi:S-adenosylmethionine hydrolase
VAIDGGNNLSFVKSDIREFRAVEAPRRGSRFQSRDYFLARAAEIAAGNLGSVGEERSVGDIPSKPEAVVRHVDGYGNTKTSVRASEFEADAEELAVGIGPRSESVSVSDAVFDAEEGTPVLAPGSGGGDDPCLEIVRQGGSAAEALDWPSPDDAIEFA